MIPDPVRRDDRRMAVRLFVFVFVLNAWFFGGGGWNQNATVALTRAIVERSQLRIDEYAAATGDRSYRDGHVYANKAPGLSVLAAPVWALIHGGARLANVDLSDPVALTAAVWIVTFSICGTAGALIAPLIYVVGRRRELPPSWCAAVGLAVSLGTPVFAFSTVLFAHVPSAALLLAAFVLVTGRSRPFAGGLAAGVATAMNYLAGPAAILVALPLLREERRLRALGRYVAGGLLPAILVGAYHTAAFGSPFRTPIDTMDPRFVSPTARWLGIFELPRLDALFGITLSPYRGLFWVSPFLLLAFAGIARSWKRSSVETLTAAGVIVYFVTANASFNGWEGGFSFGPRYLIPAIPFLAILLLEARAVLPLLFWGLVAISLSHNFVAVAVDPQPSGSIAQPLRDYLYPVLVTGRVPEGIEVMPQWPARLLEGRVAINPHTVDQAIPFTRHAPASAASRWASFNLGELAAGPGSAWSLLVPLLWGVLGAFWIARTAAARASPIRSSR